MPNVKVNDIHIDYESAGAGHPLVLVSPLGYGRWFYHKIVPSLVEHFRVITFDNRGSGGSDKPDGPYTVPMMAADTLGLMDHLGVLEAHIVGHSLGGFIAQEVIIERPELVSKVVLASTNHGGMKVVPTTPEAMEVFMNRDGDPLELIRRGITVASAPGFGERKPDVVQELMDYRLTNPVPPAQYQAQVMAGAGMASISDEDVDRRMERINVPTLIMFGEHDNVIPSGNAALMADKIAKSKVLILSGAGHIFPVEDPEGTVSALLDFLM
jgi:pimeloyl-ACP methyl ester carboxylesterase